MSELSSRLLLDRALLHEIVLSEHKSRPFDKEAFVTIAARYDHILYEMTGVSAIEGDLRGVSTIASKLVAIQPKLTVEEHERALLRTTIEEAEKHIDVQKALQYYESRIQGAGRPRSEVLGYCIRMLLISRAENCDILPWPTRTNIITGLFKAAGVLGTVTEIEKNISVIESENVAFPYCPGKNKGKNTRIYRVVAIPESPSPVTKQEQRSNTWKNFDVFLAHNTSDKYLVNILCEKLKERGLKPWIDTEQMPPGTMFQDEIQKGIANSKSAAIIIGPGGLGKWQSMELKSFISKCVDSGTSVIPILLPGVEMIPDELIFLKEFRWISFLENMEEEEGLAQLEWGIKK